MVCSCYYVNEKVTPVNEVIEELWLFRDEGDNGRDCLTLMLDD